MHNPFVTFEEARKIDPEATQELCVNNDAWVVSITEPSGWKHEIPPGSEVTIKGLAGEARVGVALDPRGRPIFDKLLYTHCPGVLIVAWGRDKQDRIRLVYLIQERPFALDEEVSDHQPLRFGQIPMGFLTEEERAMRLRDAIAHAARRELREEAGIQKILSLHIPAPATCWADPTFIRNGGYLVFAEVDFASATPPSEANDHERIFRVEHLLVREIRELISEGYDKHGVNHHMGLSLGALMIFFAHHPELFVTS